MVNINQAKYDLRFYVSLDEGTLKGDPNFAWRSMPQAIFVKDREIASGCSFISG